MPKARTGKIGRLPFAIREEVNRRLRDGQSGPKVIAWLHTLPEVLKILDDYFREEPVSAQNLSEWRLGGYQEWIARHEQIDRTKELAAYGYQLAKDNSGGAAEGAAAITGGLFLEIFESLDVDKQKALLAEKPGNYPELVAAFAKFESAQTKKESVKQNRRKLDQNDTKLALDGQKLAIEKARFERTTCELFLKFYSDRKASDIAEGKAKKEVKVEQLRLLMFGAPPGKPESGEK